MTSIEYVKFKSKTMPALAAILKIDFTYKVEQQKYKKVQENYLHLLIHKSNE